MGNGKGKTCASAGQAIRALGSGLSVAFGQFMKRPDKSGEQKILSALLGDNFFAAGAGFFHSEAQRGEQRQKCLKVLQWALGREAQLLVLDEALNALERGLLTADELRPFLADRRGTNRHLVLTGRMAPSWLLAQGDIITGMSSLAHAFERGVGATCGIEF